MPIHAYFEVFWGIFSSKASRTDLVFAVLPGFISKSVHDSLQVCIKQLQFVPSYLIQNWTFSI